MIFPRLLFSSAIALTLPALPFAASAQEKTLSEAKAAFEETDRALNQSYQTTRTKLAEDIFEQVQEEQRDWIEYRDFRAEAAARLEGGAENGQEKASPEYWKAMTYLTETRVEILDAWTRINQFSKTWEGVWIDGYGGILLIQESEGRDLRFTCTAVRGASYHLGNIAGTAKANQSTARFATQAEGQDVETWLTFLQEDDGRLRILGENTEYFHGARAYFDGQYLRVRELTAEDRKEIEEGE